MKARRKIIHAGRLWMAVQYTAIRQANQSARREARAQISSPARESLNAKLSWQKMMLTLAANFTANDLVVTLSYRNADLPPTREKADRRLTNFIRALRAHRNAEGQALVYIRVMDKKMQNFMLTLADRLRAKRRRDHVSHLLF